MAIRSSLKPRNPLFDMGCFDEALTWPEQRKGLLRPLRIVTHHLECGTLTKVDIELALSLAKRPHAYSSLTCKKCGLKPIGDFVWDGTGDKVGG